MLKIKPLTAGLFLICFVTAQFSAASNPVVEVNKSNVPFPPYLNRFISSYIHEYGHFTASKILFEGGNETVFFTGKGPFALPCAVRGGYGELSWVGDYVGRENAQAFFAAAGHSAHALWIAAMTAFNAKFKSHLVSYLLYGSAYGLMESIQREYTTVTYNQGLSRHPIGLVRSDFQHVIDKLGPVVAYTFFGALIVISGIPLYNPQHLLIARIAFFETALRALLQVTSFKDAISPYFPIPEWPGYTSPLKN